MTKRQGKVKNFPLPYFNFIFAFCIFIQNPPTTSAAMSPEVGQIIDRHILASGGRPAMLGLKSISRSGQIEVFSAEDNTSLKLSYRTDIIYPLKLREEIKGNDFIAVDRGTDGSYFWERNTNGYQEVIDEEQREYFRLTASRANRDILWVQEDFDSLALSLDSPPWATDSQCIVGSKAASVTYLCFGRQSGLLAAKGNLDEYRLFGRWTRVGNVMIPFQLIHFKNRKKAYEINLTNADADHFIDPDRFLLPKN